MHINSLPVGITMQDCSLYTVTVGRFMWVSGKLQHIDTVVLHAIDVSELGAQSQVYTTLLKRTKLVELNDWKFVMQSCTCQTATISSTALQKMQQ